MESNTPPQGTQPVAESAPLELPEHARTVESGLVLRVRGRTIRLRALRSRPRGIWFWLSILGPGLISGAVSNSAGSIATYSQAGAQFGYELIWVIVLITVSLAVVQEMSARLGAATGRGLLGLIRTQFGIGWAFVATAIVLVANFGLILGEFVGLSSAMALFGVPKLVTVGLGAALIIYLVLAGGYNRVEKIFMVMTALFITYPVAALLAHPNALAVVRGAFVPTLRANPAYIALVVGLIGTTISPYQQVFQQSAVVEKGIGRRRYGPERWDTYAGMIFANLISIFILIATAATLHAKGGVTLNNAADAAKALEPVVGKLAENLFAIGIVGASLMAVTVISISTAFAYTDAFGFQEGINLELRRAPVFYGLFVAQVLLAGVLSLIPSVPAFQLLVAVQVLNGVLFPILLVFILLLANNTRLMGKLKNNAAYNILGWGTLALTGSAVVFGLLQWILPHLGVYLFGA